MKLKQKKDGSIKGRGCADGSKQHPLADDTSSPTVSTKALFISCVIDAHEGRDVATVDIPGAFLQANLKKDEEIYMVLRGKMAELLCEIDPEKYEAHKRWDEKKGEYIIYTTLSKAVYGTIQGAIRFYEELTEFLKSRSYEVNPYDPCVFNKTINGKQITILFHVDDLKLSHVNANVVTDEIQKLQLRFGKLADLTISRGRVHEYLGMTLDFTVPKKCKVIMTEYVSEIVGSAPEELLRGRGQARTPAANGLFKINENEEQLPKHRSDTFHSLTAQLLFLCKRNRPDIQVAVAFLCTRVHEFTEEDWRKLGRVMRYVLNTKDLCLTLEVRDLTQFRWWVDSSFNVHWDSRGHSGRSGTLGKGAIISASQ